MAPAGLEPATVAETGFEPATCGLWAHRATELRHSAMPASDLRLCMDPQGVLVAAVCTTDDVTDVPVGPVLQLKSACLLFFHHV